MKKIKIPTKNLVTGMIIANNYFNRYGAVIVKSGSVLDDSHIDKLIKLEVDEIEISEFSIDNNKSSKVNLTAKIYMDSVNSFIDLYNNASVTNTIDKNVLNNMVNTITETNMERRELVDCINKVRAVDQYTYFHSMNVSVLAMLIGMWLGYSQSDIELLTEAGVLHDIGKAKIPIQILQKPGKLTDKEMELMKKHAEIGLIMVDGTKEYNNGVRAGIAYHHERMDGTGYPKGLKGNEIHEFARIISVADIFDAMTARRVYKEPISPFKVIQMFQTSFFGELDYSIVKVFIKNMSMYFVGKKVKLNDDTQAEVVFINEKDYSRPIINRDGEYIDLIKNKKIEINHIL